MKRASKMRLKMQSGGPIFNRKARNVRAHEPGSYNRSPIFFVLPSHDYAVCRGDYPILCMLKELYQLRALQFAIQ